MKDKPLSGGARLKQAGKHPVLLGLNRDEIATIRAAAEADGRPVTQFLVYHGMQAAKRILKKNSSSS